MKIFETFVNKNCSINFLRFSYALVGFFIPAHLRLNSKEKIDNQTNESLSSKQLEFKETKLLIMIELFMNIIGVFVLFNYARCAKINYSFLEVLVLYESPIIFNVIQLFALKFGLISNAQSKFYYYLSMGIGITIVIITTGLFTSPGCIFLGIGSFIMSTLVGEREAL
eukprot:Pgem_evm1s12172